MASHKIGALSIDFSIETENALKGLRNTQAQLKDFQKTIQPATQLMNDLGRSMVSVGKGMTAAITLPLAALAGISVKAASDFESSFAGVRKTVDATEKEFSILSDSIRSMSKELPVSVNELNRIAEAAGQLGISKENIVGFTRQMALLGETTNLTSDEAATATAQIQNIFGAAGKDTDRFASTLVALGNAGASTEKDIINMGLRIAGAGHVVGLTQAQVLAFASALSSVGIEAEAGGSALSRVFLKINDAVFQGGEGLENFAKVAGLSVAQFKQSFQTDAAGATIAFIDGLGRIKEAGGNVSGTIENLVGEDIRLKDMLLRVAGAGALVTDQLKIAATAYEENNAASKEAAERHKTFASQLQIVKNQVGDVAITLGQAMLPVIKNLLDAVKPLIDLVADMANGFAKLPVPVQETAFAIAAIAAAAGPVLYVGGSLLQWAVRMEPAILRLQATIAGAGGLVPALTGIATSAAAATAGIVALGAALGVGIGLLANYAIAGTRVERVLDDIISRTAGTIPIIGKWLNGTNALNAAAKDQEFILTAAAAALAKHGIVVEQDGKSLDDWQKRIEAATKGSKEYQASLATQAGVIAATDAQKKLQQQLVKTQEQLDAEAKVVKNYNEAMANLYRERVERALKAAEDEVSIDKAYTQALADQYRDQVELALKAAQDEVAIEKKYNEAKADLYRRDVEEALKAVQEKNKNDEDIEKRYNATLADIYRERVNDALRAAQDEVKARDAALKQSIDDVKSSAGHIFDDMFIRGEGVFKSLQNMLKGGALSLGRTIFEDITGALFGPILNSFRTFFNTTLKGIIEGALGGIGKSIGGLIGIGGTAAGATTGAAGTAGSAGLGSFGLFGLSGAATLGIGAAIAGGVAIASHYIGLGRETANKFTSGSQGQFDRDLGRTFNEFQKSRDAGTLTLDEAKKLQSQLTDLLRGITDDAEEFKAKGKTERKVIDQFFAQQQQLFGKDWVNLTSQIDASIASLTTQAQATVANVSTTSPVALAASQLAGIPDTVRSQSASSIMAKAVEVFTTSIDIFKDAVTSVGGPGRDPTTINVSITSAPVFNIEATDVDLKLRFRDEIAPEVLRDMQTDANGFASQLVQIIKTRLDGVVTSGAAA